MSSFRLTTDVQLAAEFEITVEKLHELRKRNHWPFVRLGRFDIRFTDQQVEQIVAAQSVVPGKQPATSGLTVRSASHRRAS